MEIYQKWQLHKKFGWRPWEYEGEVYHEDIIGLLFIENLYEERMKKERTMAESRAEARRAADEYRGQRGY